MGIYHSKLLPLSIFLLTFFLFTQGYAQPVTGVWRGKIIRGTGLKQRTAPLEVKLIAQGDSIVGTVYYYGNGKNYIRYSLKGYFGQEYNTVFWQDYFMINMIPAKAPEARQFSELMKVGADYSCPDGKTLRLDGNAQLPGVPDMKLELKKVETTMFPDEWDEVIAGYFLGMARTEVVDSVWQLQSEPLLAKKEMVKIPETGNPQMGAITANTPPAPTALEGIAIQPPTATPPTRVTSVTEKPKSNPVESSPKPKPNPVAPEDITAQMAKSSPPAVKPAETQVQVLPTPKPTVPTANSLRVSPGTQQGYVSPQPIPQPIMQTAFASRKKVVQTEIPIAGDTLELRFYDNAEVDGDSISLFLNGVAFFQQVRLEVKPYIVKIALENLPAVSELAMVAENLGSIPPNTAYMEAFVQGKRYTARLESTEQTTGVIRLVKQE